MKDIRELWKQPASDPFLDILMALKQPAIPSFREMDDAIRITVESQKPYKAEAYEVTA